MKAFRFTLEAVRTLRQRQEQEALEVYIRALLARQQAFQMLEAVDQRIGLEFVERRQMLAGGCTAAQASHAQSYHGSLQTQRGESVAALFEAEQRASEASQAMLAARQQREMVDVYRGKQQALHQRLALREEQKIMDEFATRRVTAPCSAQTEIYHD